MNPDSPDRQNERGDDGWGEAEADETSTTAAPELAELQEAAGALRDRITSPDRYPQPFPQEVTLLMVARLLETIAEAGPTPTPDRWQSVVDAADEIAHHVRRAAPPS